MEAHSLAGRAAIITPEHSPNIPIIWSPSLLSPPATMALGSAPVCSRTWVIATAPRLPTSSPSPHSLSSIRQRINYAHEIAGYNVCLKSPPPHPSSSFPGDTCLLQWASFSSSRSPSKLILLLPHSFESSFRFSQVTMNSSDTTWAPRNLTFSHPEPSGSQAWPYTTIFYTGGLLGLQWGLSARILLGSGWF